MYENSLYKDIEKVEGKSGIGIVSMLKLLHTPAKLHELSSLFKSIDSTITELKVGGLVGLFGVAYAELGETGKLDNVEKLSNLKVVGIVNYVKLTDTERPNIDTMIMKDISNPTDERNQNLQGFSIQPDMNEETVGVYKNDMNEYHIVFRGTRMDAKSFFTEDMARNTLNLAGSPELFNREPYAKNYKLADKFLRDIMNRNPKDITIQGYSLGGIGALYLAAKHPHITTKIYNPILGNN